MIRTVVVASAAVSALLISGANAQHSTTYKYDANGRLVRADGPGSQDRRYGFDKAGNRLIARSAPNDPPVAVDDITGISEGSATLVFDLLANDSDPNGHPIKVTRIFNINHNGDGSYGAAHIYLRPDGRVNITANHSGTTTFSYTVTDMESESVGTMSILVIGTGGGGGCSFFC
jgi:YD repeat-containing protein